MKQVRQGTSNPDMLTLLLIVLVVFLAAFGLFHLSPHAHKTPPDVMQRHQFKSLDAAIELSMFEFDGYPPSDANDPAGQPYCGAMKLAEALMGQDLLGFHTKSIFRRDGLDAEGILLYPVSIDDLPNALRESNMRARKGRFLMDEDARACRLVDIYGKGNTGPFPEDTLVLCDTYGHQGASGQRRGMPILYYRANPSGTAHDVVNPDNSQNIFNYQDNQALIALGVPGTPGQTHPLADPKRFYLNTQNRKTSKSMPSAGNSFILISAGQDGLYGTADDICNFEWKYRRR